MKYAVFQMPMKVSEKVMAACKDASCIESVLGHVAYATPKAIEELGIKGYFPPKKVKVVLGAGQECGYSWNGGIGGTLELHLGDFAPELQGGMLAYCFAEATMQDFAPLDDKV